MSRNTPVHSGYTIINGSGTGSNGGRIDVWAEYKLGVQSIAGNYTPITAYFYAALNPSYTSSTSYVSGLNSSFKVNGTAGTGVSNGAYDFTSSDTVNFLGSYSGNITHAADGTKTITIAGSFTTLSSYISGGSVSASVTLPTILRESTIEAKTPVNIGETSTITVQQKNKSFTHSVAYKFGSLSGYITAGGRLSASEVKFSDTSIPFVVPESFYAQISDSPSGTCTLTCRTYSGSTQIGDPKTCAFTAIAEKSKCEPLVSGTVEDINEKTLALTGDKNVLISRMSTALCTITATARNGASITQKRIGAVAVSGNTHTIENIETGSILFEATDSRGYTGTDPRTVEIVPYIKLTNNASVKRTDPTSGNAELALCGNCFQGDFGASENTLTVKYQINSGEEVVLTPEIKGDNSYNMTVALTGLDYTQTHSVTVTVTDALDSVFKTLTVKKGIPVFDWGENDFQFHVPVGCERSISGVYIRTVRLSGTSTITVQSRFATLDGIGHQRQSVFFFGNDNHTLLSGVIGISDSGGMKWSGTDGVSVAAGENGQFVITLPTAAYDIFTLISPEFISIV